MLAAEKQTKKTKTTSWSPKFAKAIAAKAFWKIGLSLKMTHTHPSKKFEQWAAEMGVSEFKEIDIAGAKKELRTAQRELNKIERNADNLRNEHLRSLLTQAELNGDELQQERRLKILIRAHAQKQHFKRLKMIFKPKEAGGLSYILVPHFFGILDNSRQRSPSTENRVESYARKRKYHGRIIGVIRRSSAKEQQLDNSY
jgi:hypothetical protein